MYFCIFIQNSLSDRDQYNRYIATTYIASISLVMWFLSAFIYLTVKWPFMWPPQIKFFTKPTSCLSDKFNISKFMLNWMQVSERFPLSAQWCSFTCRTKAYCTSTSILNDSVFPQMFINNKIWCYDFF